jgi:hypothetical protein
MNEWPMIVACFMGTAVLLAIFIGGIVLCVRYDHQGKIRHRELEHVERMKSIEQGLSLAEDPRAVRSRALGAIGVVLPIASLSAAILGSCFALSVKGTTESVTALGLIWGFCASICWVGLPLVLERLREPINGPAINDPRMPTALPQGVPADTRLTDRLMDGRPGH